MGRLINLTHEIRHSIAKFISPNASALTIYGGSGTTTARHGLLFSEGNVQKMIAAFRGVVYACVDVRAKAVANAAKAGKFQVAFKTGPEDINPAPHDHPLALLLNNPNPHFTQWELWYLTVTYMDLAGNSYWWIARNLVNKEPVGLWPISPKNVRIIVGNPKAGEKLIKAYEVFWGGSEPTIVDENDIIQLKHPNPIDPYFYGLSKLMRAAQEVDIDDFISRYQRDFFENFAEPAGIVTFPEELTPDAREAFREEWIKRFGRKPGEIGILENGAKYTPTNDSKSEMSYLDSIGINRKKIQEVFGVPDSKLMREENITARATLETLDSNFQGETVEPLNSLIAGQLTLDMCPEFDKKRSTRNVLIVHNLSVVPKDQRFQLEKDKADLEMGKVSINEVRDREGLAPIKGGEEPLVSLAVAPLSRVVAEPPDPAKDPANVPPADDPTELIRATLPKNAIETFEIRLRERLKDAPAEKLGVFLHMEIIVASRYAYGATNDNDLNGYSAAAVIDSIGPKLRAWVTPSHQLYTRAREIAVLSLFEGVAQTRKVAA